MSNSTAPSREPEARKEPEWPRMLMRYQAARYMGRSLRKFDQIKHLFRVDDNGLIRYDRVLMDRHIDLSHAA